MKIKQKCDNGNVAVENQYQYIQLNNRHWLKLDSTQLQHKNRTSLYENFNANNTLTQRTEYYDNKTLSANNNGTDADADVKLSVCNRLFRLNNAENNVISSYTLNNRGTDSIKGKTDIPSLETTDKLQQVKGTYNQKGPNVDILDTDEMSRNSLHPVPRGIVNPNYPGFQHLAHTLQDYSTTIESYYQSENEMTDDDIDIDLADSINESNVSQTAILEESKNIRNNNCCPNKIDSIQNDLILKPLESVAKSEIPDLLQTVSKGNNNNGDICYDNYFFETDIENNFHKKDIIGDFNKEVEDEIKLLLNYNININDDLEELRKDIKDTLAKPIENTINNISEVVNHVIKKLVENDIENESSVCCPSNVKTVKEINEINKDNETNTRIEMNLSRPTFLLLDTRPKNAIADAVLSDGKDEININYESEIDTENLSHNVENTIKQLSTELRKIIPKLEEMREQENLWMQSKSSSSILTDRNSNEIEDSTNCQSSNIKTEKRIETNTSCDNVKIPKIEIRSAKDQQLKDNNTKVSHRHVKSNSSVHKNEKVKETLSLGTFDVYNIETALPKIDLDAIESHLKAAKEAERRKRNDREEIRKRLAMGVDTEEYYSIGHIPVERPTKKPSLHSRLQNGKNLQICYMNETASDNESQHSDSERSSSSQSLLQTSIFSKSSYNHPYHTRPLSVNITKHDKISSIQSAKWRPSSFPLKATKSKSSHSLGHIELRESDFYALQATLQTEARIALAQAKELARTQMERERRGRAVSPVTAMLRASMQLANAPLAPDRRRLSRQLLTDMNVAQLQVIVNSLHGQIERLNEALVSLLMARDDLHMSQDAVLVDIEDLTRYFILSKRRPEI